MNLLTRIPRQVRTYGDITIAVDYPPDESTQFYEMPPAYKSALLVADVPSGIEPQDAIEYLAPVLTSALDLLAFDMGAVLLVGAANVVDITPPVVLGEERAWSSWTSAPFDQWQAGDLQTVQGRLVGLLPAGVSATDDSKTSAILRWFVKSLSTNILQDQFIFLWIAFEILVGASDTQVEKPYTVDRCQHQIASCPECGMPTARKVQGPTNQAVLQEYGVSSSDAHRMWRLRQMMHGNVLFDSKEMKWLPALVQPLRAVVAAGLKDRLGLGPEDPPLVAMAGFSVHPAMALVGTTEITEEMIKPLLQ